MAKDALTLLRNDHRTAEKLFARYRQAADHTQKRLAAEEIIRALSVHTSVEEEVLYPVVGETLPDGEQLAEQARSEHRAIKQELAELDGMDPSDERFEPRVRAVIAGATRHFVQEEGTTFPRLRQALPRKRLKVMGEALGVARLVAPTHPHPSLPDTPPANVVVGAAAAVVDRARDAARDVRRTATDTATKRTAAKASARKKPATKRSATKKPAAKRTTAKKAPARKKAPAKKAQKKAPAKRTPAKRAAARKTTPRRAA